MKKASFFLFDSFTAGILFLIFTTLLFLMIPSYSYFETSNPELMSFYHSVKYSGELHNFIQTDSPVVLQEHVDNSVSTNLCLNLTYYDKDGVYQNGILKDTCSQSDNQKTVLYGTTYVDDLYLIRLEGWYE